MYEVPSIFHSQGKAVDRDREEAEILAKAFNMAAGDYFQRQVVEETRQHRLKEELKKIRNILIVIMVLGILAIALYILAENILCIGTGGMLILITIGLYFVKYKRIDKDINNSRIILKSMTPEKKVTFVSKVHVPLYLVPYDKGVMLFDPKMRGYELKVELVNLASNQIDMDMAAFKSSASRYEDVILSRGAMSVEDIMNFNRDILQEKILEKEIIDSMYPIVNTTSQNEWIRDSFKLRVHTPETVTSNSLTNVFNHSFITKPELLVITSAPYPAPHMIESVEKLRGVEMASRSSSIMDLVNEWHRQIDAIPIPLEEVLANNIDLLNRNSDVIKQKTGFELTRQVCIVCFNEALVKKNIKTEYDLQEFIAEQFRSSIDVMSNQPKCLRCGNTVELDPGQTGDVTCPSCGHSANMMLFDPPQKRANDMIRDRINVDLNDLPMEGMLNLPQLQKQDGDWECLKHKGAQFMELSMLSDVMAHTGNELWVEMKKPIMDSVKEANRTSTQNRQKWKDQNLALTPIRQIYTDLEVELKEVETKLAQAEKILEVLRGY